MLCSVEKCSCKHVIRLKNAIYWVLRAGFLRGVPLGEGVGGKVRPKQVRMVVPCAEGQAPRLIFYCKKLTKLVFMLRFGQLKVEKDSLLKTAFLHYPFFCGFVMKLFTLIYFLRF